MESCIIVRVVSLFAGKTTDDDGDDNDNDNNNDFSFSPSIAVGEIWTCANDMIFMLFWINNAPLLCMAQLSWCVSQNEMESKQNRRTGLTPQRNHTFLNLSKQCWKFEYAHKANWCHQSNVHIQNIRWFSICRSYWKRMPSTIRVVYAGHS